MPPETILIAGPTASGKSAYAIKLAREMSAQSLGKTESVIINADSMQVYRQLQIITARPVQSEMGQYPHLLYGHRDAARSYSVASWLHEVKPILDDARTGKKILIFVGGTGLYFKALVDGLSPVPQLDPDIRKKWRDFVKAHSDDDVGNPDGANLHKELMVRDPVAAKKLRPSDNQRLIRALEVIDSTGKSIVEWQNENRGSRLIDGAVRKILLMPVRHLLHERINNRFERMVEMGAVEEVKQLLALELDPGLPVMKAIGVPQIQEYLAGEISLNLAIEKTKAASRQYAKRQSTWFNNQFDDDWQRLSSPDLKVDLSPTYT